jgi:hypothetical protein
METQIQIQKIKFFFFFQVFSNIHEKNDDDDEKKQEQIVYTDVRNLVKYLRLYNVASNHYTLDIYPEDKYKSVIIQIDEQEGRVDRQISKTKCEFINGTCFSIDWDEIPNEVEYQTIKDKLRQRMMNKKKSHGVLFWTNSKLKNKPQVPLDE